MTFRPYCDLFGCTVERECPCCGRCGADIYDSWYIQPEDALLYPWWRFRDWIRGRIPHRIRCAWCGKVLGWSTHHDLEIDFCSERCAEDWVPF